MSTSNHGEMMSKDCEKIILRWFMQKKNNLVHLIEGDMCMNNNPCAIVQIEIA